MTKIVSLLIALEIYGGVVILPVNAQFDQPRQQDPNLKNYYMGRRQIEVLDNSPVIINRSSGATPQNVPGLQGDTPLPKAGFFQYSSTVQGSPKGLPKVVNGVPPKLPPAGQKGYTRRLRVQPQAKVHAKPRPQTVERYQQTYQTSRSVAPAPPAARSYGNSTAVKGRLLPWANQRHKNY